MVECKDGTRAFVVRPATPGLRVGFAAAQVLLEGRVEFPHVVPKPGIVGGVSATKPSSEYTGSLRYGAQVFNQIVTVSSQVA